MAIPTDCQRVVQISALDDLQTIQMRIDLEIQGDVIMRYELVLRRMASEAVVFGRKPEKKSQPRQRRRR